MKQVQLSLFDHPTLNISKDLKRAMHAAVKNSKLSRDEIVDRINELAGRYGVRLVKGKETSLHLSTFEKWINPDDLTRQMPVRALPVFCAVVGCPELLDIIANPMGLRVIGPDEVKLLNWARAYWRQRTCHNELYT